MSDWKKDAFVGFILMIPVFLILIDQWYARSVGLLWVFIMLVNVSEKIDQNNELKKRLEIAMKLYGEKK